MNPTGTTSRRATLGIALALFIGTLWLYWPVRGHQFVNFDDTQYITRNAMVTNGVTWAGIKWAITESHFHMWHPLTSLSHMLDCELFGLRAGPHHLENALLHAVNGVLLFGLLLRLTGTLWRSAFVAALFVWHPLRVESVAWAAERKDVLCTLFWLLTTLAYAHHTRQPSRRRYWAVVGLFALGIMTKPMMVTLPFALLLLDVWPLRRWSASAWEEARRRNAGYLAAFRESTGNWGLLREKAPLFVLAAILAAVTFFAQRGGAVVVSLEKISLVERFANAAVAYWRYIGKTIWPVDLAVVYPHT
ncbi:MAG: glycosyltransferase family 39 protein, partial [Verrucomicrobiota bacterium]